MICRGAQAGPHGQVLGTWHSRLVIFFSSSFRPCCFFDARPRLMCLSRVTVGEPGIWTRGGFGPVVPLLFRKGWDERRFYVSQPWSCSLLWPRRVPSYVLHRMLPFLPSLASRQGGRWQAYPGGGSFSRDGNSPRLPMHRSTHALASGARRPLTRGSLLRDMPPPRAFTGAGNAPRDRPGYYHLWH